MQNPELRRALGPWAAIAVVIGTTIGSGIFLVPSDMVKAVGSPLMVFAVFVFEGLSLPRAPNFIDVPLRQNGAQPRAQLAAPVEIIEERFPAVRGLAQTI